LPATTSSSYAIYKQKMHLRRGAYEKGHVGKKFFQGESVLRSGALPREQRGVAVKNRNLNDCDKRSSLVGELGDSQSLTLEKKWEQGATSPKSPTCQTDFKEK